MEFVKGKRSWNKLLDDIVAGGHPFKRPMHNGLRMSTKKGVGTNLFAHSCGQGYNPEESVHLSDHMSVSLNSKMYRAKSSLGSTPSEYREKFFSKKG